MKVIKVRKRNLYIGLISVLILFTVFTISIINRYRFGTWLPNLDPNRIEFRDRRYYPSGNNSSIQEKDLKLVKSSAYWGRGLFVDKESYLKIDINKQYKTYIILYLKRTDSSFSTYTLSGGP